MLLLSLLELAFGQLFFNHMRASVCVLVWGCSCYLIDAILYLCPCTCLGLLLLSDIYIYIYTSGVVQCV